MFKNIVLSCLVFLVFALNSQAIDKREARVEKIADYPTKELRVRPFLSAADTCYVVHSDTIVWQIDSWVVGAELYKSYLVPDLCCENAYPYTIVEVNMPMSFAASTDIYVSVDVEGVDSSDPSCPVPGELLSISSEYGLTVPEAGVYNIWIPLDEPCVVNGPFFAGFYISNTLDVSSGAAVITDDDPALCVSYNIWDTDIGYIDLCDNDYYSFPGRLILYVSGIPGGSGGTTTQPEPVIELVSHNFNDTLFSNAEIWANETSGSDIIDYVSFEYSTGGSYYEINRDYDGTKPLRDGVNQAVSGYGYTVNWDLSPLYEGFYTIRATAVDTLGRTASASTTVYVEPTPPLPNIISPENFDNFCPPVDILMSCTDENLSAVNLFYRQGLTDYSIGMGTLYQFDLGDNNSNPYDGNLAANGEFGDYYCAPAAAALAVQVWYDRGYTYLYTPPVTSLAENLATEFKTRENLGTYDEDILRGLYDYFLPRGAILKFKYERNPDYATMRTWVEFEGRSLIIGLGGNPGVWLALDGFKGYQQSDSTCIITVSNPLTGSLSDLSMRNYYGTNQVYFNYGWKPIDIVISVFASNWTNTSEFIGTDNNDADGWSYNWASDNLTEMESYYIHATAIDDTNIKGTSTVLIKYDCTNAFLQGDFNNDGQANFVDLNYLIAFITQNGAPPVGGIRRGDCNCDNVVNIADIVYYLNFLFGTAGSPCY